MDGESTTTARRIVPVRRSRRAAIDFVGQTINGRYSVRSLIGAGGMGDVYAAVHVGTGRGCALKVIRPAVLTDSNARRFRREVRATASLRHKHLCQLYDFGTTGGVPYLVMEHLPGETLRQRIADEGALDVADAVGIVLQILDGLSAAHAAGILHRDIKPGNIFVTTTRKESPLIKVIDFGLAKALPRDRWVIPREESTKITRTDVIPGTPSYLTPEQLCGVKELDERVDVWATGLILYEMLVGKRAFNGHSAEGLAERILFDTPEPVMLVRSDVPRGLDRVIEKALSKRREDRFGSAAEFRQAVVDTWARHRAAGVVRAKQAAFTVRRTKQTQLPDDGIGERRK